MTCVSCGAEASLLIAPGVLPAKAAIYRCSACGLDFFEDVADTDYWETAGQTAIYEDPAVAEERTAGFVALLDRIEHLAGKGALLDVGAGRGEFALAASARGWQVSVVEPSAKATDGLAARGVREVQNVAFEHFEPCCAYRCVTLLDLVEHTRDPRSTLMRAAACLEPGGALVILTPDGGSVVRAAALRASRLWRRAESLLKYQYYLPHYSYVNTRWLRGTATEAGLEVASLTRVATPKRFLLAKLKTHYGKYRGNSLFRGFVASTYPLTRFIGNKLLFVGLKGIRK